MKIVEYKARRKVAGGVVLPTVLILILVLSVSAVLIIEQVTTQTRMVGNSAASSVSIQAAEATLRIATNNIIAGNYTETMFRSNSGGLYFYRPGNYTSSVPVPWKSTAGWASAKTVSQLAGGITSEQKFIIEEMPDVLSPGGGSQKAFRITARVKGPGNQGSIMLQTLYKL